MKIKIHIDKCFSHDKPGISVHPDLRSKEKTISDWFLRGIKSKDVGESLFVGDEKPKKKSLALCIGWTKKLQVSLL